jgi:hypothetical protein
MAVMRSPSKNMCSVRHRPMPSAPKERAVSGIGGRFGVGAHLHAPRRVGPFHDQAEIAGQLRLQHGNSALEHLAGRAVNGDGVAGLQGGAKADQGAVSPVDAQTAGAGDARACPCRAPRRPRGWSCRHARSKCLRRRACRECLPGWFPPGPGCTSRPAGSGFFSLCRR